mmetsp:Transcript_39641/g.60700  ORF Transcript_39641/g.60700 Transcript_39641/m.60700 type:complete len:122 (+) Transcript_39641:1127-1492(+)
MGGGSKKKNVKSDKSTDGGLDSTSFKARQYSTEKGPSDQPDVVNVDDQDIQQMMNREQYRTNTIKNNKKKGGNSSSEDDNVESFVDEKSPTKKGIFNEVPEDSMKAKALRSTAFFVAPESE